MSWLIPLRLAAFCIVSLIVFGWIGYPGYMHVPFLLYCFFALATLLLLVFQKDDAYPVLFRFFLGLHFGLELVCEAGIVYSTGSLYSPFSALFLLTIVSTTLAYRLVGTLVVASSASLAFLVVTWINSGFHMAGGGLLWSDRGSLSTDDVFFYSAFLHILIFYLVAFIAGYLAQKLQKQDRELRDTSVALFRARLETGDILRHLNSGLLTIDRDGKIFYFNHAAENILGLKETEVAGENYLEVFRGRLATLGDNLSDVLTYRRRLARSELSIQRTDGSFIPIGISTSILFDEEFEVRGLIAIFQDITEAKDMERRVRRADRMAAVGELSAYIAHEIRNPLASISGSVEVLKDELEVADDNEKLMSLIIKESGRLNKILSDFLNYARIGPTRLGKVEINRVILDTLELIRQHPSYHSGIDLELESAGHLVYIGGDEDQMKQMLLNLAVNSCEALGDQPGYLKFEVRVLEVKSSRPNVEILVKDSGPGIPTDLQQKIFMPFYSSKKTGTGLGLAIVSRLVHENKGTIEVSSGQDRGTQFSLHFYSFDKNRHSEKPELAATAE